MFYDLGLHPCLRSLSSNQILRAAFAAVFEGVSETLCFGNKSSREGRELVKRLRVAISYQLVAHLVFCILHVASLLPHYFEATRGAFCWQCGPDSLQELNSRLGPRIGVLGQSSLRDSEKQPAARAELWDVERPQGRWKRRAYLGLFKGHQCLSYKFFPDKEKQVLLGGDESPRGCPHLHCVTPHHRDVAGREKHPSFSLMM